MSVTVGSLSGECAAVPAVHVGQCGVGPPLLHNRLFHGIYSCICCVFVADPALRAAGLVTDVTSGVCVFPLQKAGFMLVELAFASSVRDRRHVVILVSKSPLSLNTMKQTRFSETPGYVCKCFWFLFRRI